LGGQVTEAIPNWKATYTRGVSTGSHVARLVVRNEYGQEIVREVEFTVCEDTMIPVSADTPVQMTAEASVNIEGYAPDCTATMTVDWKATAGLYGPVYLKAAWLRIDGEVVDSSHPARSSYPLPIPGPTGEGSFRLPLFFVDPPGSSEPENGGNDRMLGGSYTRSVQPGSTVLIEVIALGTDCKYYIKAWEKPIPRCPQAWLPPSLPPCFSADTLVLMGDDSTKHISEIQLGDMVKSYDVASGQVIVKEVVTTNNGQSDHYYVINGNLKVTPPHPFFTLDRGWVPVESLQMGDQIKSVDGITTVTSVELVLEGQVIYNIRVEESGNFFVSANGNDFYLVHQGL